MEVSSIICGYSWSHSFPVARIACKGGRKLPTPTSEPPKPTPPMTTQNVSGEPLSEKPKKSTCGPPYYDPLLIMSWDRMLLLLLKDRRNLMWTYLRTQLSLGELGIV